MRYEEFLSEIESYADENYKKFHQTLLKNDKIKLFGVRVPIMRKLAKKYFYAADEILSFPNEYYEVNFIKLCIVSQFDYDRLLTVLDGCVESLDNWAACDSFAPKSIKAHKEEFLPTIRRYLESDKEFVQRFALTTLLHFYVEERYLEVIFAAIERSDRTKFYVMTAAAWLAAETLAKYYSRAVGFIADNTLDKNTHNLAIRKAVESFRLSGDEKNYLKGMKR